MDKISRLKELKQLLDDGLLTQEEFNKYKSELIDGDIKNQNDEVKTFNTSIEGNIGKEENLDNLNASFIEQNKTKDQQSEKKYVQDLSSSKTNHSYGRYILAILFFVVGGFYIFYHFVLKDKWANIDKIESQQNFDNLNAKTRFTYLTQPVDDLESMSVTGISNEKELYAYLDEVAVFWCSEWKKAQGYQNENKRFEEMLKVDRCINAYPLGFQQGLIMLNDLPMELNTKAREHFQQKVKNLGFDPFWNEKSAGESADLDDEIESFENGRSNLYDEDGQEEEIVNIQGVPFDEINPRILYKPDPKALHPEWKESELGGSSYSFDGKKKIINSKGVFLFGDLISPRGGVMGGGPFYIIYSEWNFSGIY